MSSSVLDHRLTADYSCEPHHFKCLNAPSNESIHCIEQIFTCDGQADCEDFSDEINCPISISIEPPGHHPLLILVAVIILIVLFSTLYFAIRCIKSLLKFGDKHTPKQHSLLESSTSQSTFIVTMPSSHQYTEINVELASVRSCPSVPPPTPMPDYEDFNFN